VSPRVLHTPISWALCLVAAQARIAGEDNLIEKRIILSRLVPLLLALLSSVWLVGCALAGLLIPPLTQPSPTQTPRAIVFETLTRGDSYTAELQVPALLVVRSAADGARCTEWLKDPDIARRIEEVDFGTTSVVALFRGRMGSSGYGIAIQAISLASGTVQLTVDLTNPAPGQNVSDEVSYPCHIILVPREQLPMAPGTIWAVYDTEGSLLVETRYP
jgi:hypothetical protein